MGDVVILPCVTRLDLDPKRVLSAALDKELSGVFVMGFDKEGEVYFASSYADGGTVMWLMELAKRRLLDVAEKER